jgi:hypothetical protein
MVRFHPVVVTEMKVGLLVPERGVAGVDRELEVQ